MDMLKKLKNKGLTKWKISKMIGVSWHTIHMWERGVFKPNKKHLEDLEKAVELSER